jgi:hypothetical protein
MKNTKRVFPVPTDHVTPGMDLRDYFAAKAMQGLLASKDYSKSKLPITELCDDAYLIADNMLTARELVSTSTGNTRLFKNDN